MTEIRSKRRAYTKKSKKSQRTTRRRVRGGEPDDRPKWAKNLGIPLIKTSVKTGGTAVLSQKYVIYGFSKYDRFRDNKEALLGYKGKVQIKIDGPTFAEPTEFTDMKTFFEAVENDKFEAKVNVEVTTKSQKQSNSKNIHIVIPQQRQKTFSDNDFKTEIFLTQYITFNEATGRNMLIQLYYWAEGMKLLIAAKAERNTAQKKYENLQKIPLTPGVSDFSFPTATPHWRYGLRELKEVSVEFK